MEFLTTIFTTALGASIPVGFGFVFYRFQKSADRKEKLHFEQRALYVDLIGSLGDVVLSATTSENKVPDIQIYSSAKVKIAAASLYSSEEVTKICNQCLKGISMEEMPEGAISIGELAKLLRDELAC